MEPKDGKPEPVDPETAMRMVELELIQQRAARQQATPYGGLRTASIIFLLVIILCAMLAFYYAFFLGGLDELRARNSAQPSPSAPAISRPP